MSGITYFSQLDPNKTYTYADYLTWQFDEWVELIKGKVRLMSPAPKRRHQLISRNLEFPLMQFLRGQRCEVYHAPFDVRLSRSTPNGDASIETVVQPDICVICDPNKLDERGCLGAPDWIIEIVSPGTAGHDMTTKFALYEESGVSEYWLVFPNDKNVVVYELREGRYHLCGEYYQPGPIPARTLPGFTVPWDEVFAGA